jgi:hypothetical protein
MIGDLIDLAIRQPPVHIGTVGLFLLRSSVNGAVLWPVPGGGLKMDHCGRHLLSAAIELRSE